MTWDTPPTHFGDRTEEMGDHHVHLHPHDDPVSGSPDPGTFPREHIERYVEAAAARGVEEVCFTEHLFRMRESDPVLGDFWRNESAKDSRFPVLLGLEVDYFPETIDAVLDLLAPYPWDLLVGGVHWIGGFAFDEVEMVPEFNRRDVDQVFQAYFDLETQQAASGTVDLLAPGSPSVAKRSIRRTVPFLPFKALGLT
jgi:histidinol-phosphatase (PHP family)